MVVSLFYLPKVLDRIEGDGTIWEQEPLKG